MSDTERMANALERIADVLEAYAGVGSAAVNGAPSYSPPPVHTGTSNWTCPIHHTVKTVPAGVSSRTGKAYTAFQACAETGCSEKPPR